MLNLSFILIYFYSRASVDMLWEFCWIKNYADFDISLKAFFLSFAVPINPTESFKDPKMIKVVPNLFSKSNETPLIRHSWKNELICFSVSPK